MNLSISPLLAAMAQHGGENEPLDLAGPAAGANSAGGGSLVRTIVGLASVLAVILVVGSGEHGVTPVRAYTEAEAQALGIFEEEDPAPPAANATASRALDTLRGWTVRG